MMIHMERDRRTVSIFENASILKHVSILKNVSNGNTVSISKLCERKQVTSIGKRQG